jgi:hypothetical protein
VLHTLIYAAYLEDPLSWTLLAIGAALALIPARSRERDAHDAADGGGARSAAPAPARQPAQG